MQSDKIVALTTAAGVELEPIWASLLAKALEGKNVKELLSNVGAGGAAPAAGGAAPAASAGGAADAPKEEEKKEEEKEESDDDMVRPSGSIADLCSADFVLGLRSLRLILCILSFCPLHLSFYMSCIWVPPLPCCIHPAHSASQKYLENSNCLCLTESLQASLRERLTPCNSGIILKSEVR